jgi:hypothetical protein
MVKLEELRAEALKNPDVRAAYEAEKKVLAEEVAEWERPKRRAGDPAVRNIEAR